MGHLTAPAELIDALAERYTVSAEIGRGGMASVYRARDRKHERDVAIKVLDAELGAAVGTDRFLTEIRTTANLQHPHILPPLRVITNFPRFVREKLKAAGQ